MQIVYISLPTARSSGNVWSLYKQAMIKEEYINSTRFFMMDQIRRFFSTPLFIPRVASLTGKKDLVVLKSKLNTLFSKYFITLSATNVLPVTLAD